MIQNVSSICKSLKKVEGGTFPLPHLVSHVAQMPTEQIWSNIIIQKRGRHGPQKNSAHHLQRGQSQGAWPPGADPSTLGGRRGAKGSRGAPRKGRERERECLETEVWEQEEKKTVLSAGSQEEKISTRSQKSKRLNKREKKSIG